MRFNAKPDQILWYYQGIAKALHNFNSPIVKVLTEEISEMARLVKV